MPHETYDVEINDVQKYILSLLYAKNAEPLKGKLWFQKEIFLISKNFPEINEELDFDPYLYGPQSEIAEDELDQLAKMHLAKVEGKKITLTEMGKKIAKEIYGEDKKTANLIERLKDFANDLTSNELLAFIYFSYPDMAVESAEYQNIFNNRKPLALSILKKKKISVAKAAEIAGTSIEEILEGIKK